MGTINHLNVCCNTDEPQRIPVKEMKANMFQ